MKEKGYYKTDLIVSGKLRDDLDESRDLTSIEVEIPNDIFAPMPNDWKWRWVNWWFKNPPKDQCQFRKRKWFFAYPLQPFLAAIYLGGLFLFRLAAAVVLLLCGFISLNFVPIAHLFSADTDDIWDSINYRDEKPLVTINWRDKERLQRHRFYFLMPLTPIFWLTIFGILCITSWKSGVPGPDQSKIYVTFMITLMLTFVWGMIDLHRYREMKRKLYEPEIPPAWVTEQDLLLCSEKPMVADINYLPPKRRTIRLKFLGFKGKVCKPFPS